MVVEGVYGSLRTGKGRWSGDQGGLQYALNDYPKPKFDTCVYYMSCRDIYFYIKKDIFLNGLFTYIAYIYT